MTPIFQSHAGKGAVLAPARQRGRGGSPVIGFIEVIWNFFWRLWEGMRERCLRELGRGGGSRIRLEWRKGGRGRKETKEEREGLWTRDKRSNHRGERETKYWKDLRLIRANVTHGSEVVIYGRK